MTTTTSLTYTFNRDDIRRVHASFAAEYRMASEWTSLHSPAVVTAIIADINWLAEEQYLQDVHLQLRSSTGVIREAVVYRVSTNASGWSCDRPSGLYWNALHGDSLEVLVSFSQKWRDLTQAERDSLTAVYLLGWGTSSFDGDYGAMSSAADRRFASRAYGLESIRYSG